jgi:hypothetical protein
MIDRNSVDNDQLLSSITLPWVSSVNIQKKKKIYKSLHFIIMGGAFKLDSFVLGTLAKQEPLLVVLLPTVKTCKFESKVSYCTRAKRLLRRNPIARASNNELYQRPKQKERKS